MDLGHNQQQHPTVHNGGAGGGSVAQAVRVSDRWQGEHDMWHLKHDTWHVSPDTWHMTPDFLKDFLGFLADPGEASGCSINSLVTEKLIQSAFSSHSFMAPPRPNGKK